MLDMLSDTQHAVRMRLSSGTHEPQLVPARSAAPSAASGSRRDGGAYGIAPYPETGAHQRPAIGPVGRATG